MCRNRRILASALLPLALAISCRDASTPEPAAELVLTRQVAGLRALLDERPSGSLVSFDDVLVVVSEKLLQSLIDVALPIEGTVSDTYLVRLERASVTLDDGLALVRLEGRAALAGSLAESAFADVVVYGDLDVVEIHPTSNALRARVGLIAFEARALSVMGKDAPGRRLVAQLGREKLETLMPLVSGIDIPVRIEHQIELPRIGPGPINVAERILPIAVEVREVTALRHQLFVSLGVAVTAESLP